MFKALLAFASLASLSYAAITKRVACADGVHTATNAACCAWFPVLDDLQTNLFDSQCGQDAREALRLTFHDGIAFSPTLGGGGSDGSIITFASTELTFPPNDDFGVSDIVDSLTPLVGQFNVTPGDLIAFAASVAMSNCEGVPTLQFLTGRAPPVAAAPPGLVSSPGDSADTIIARFNDVGFTAVEIVHLLASHSVGAADGVTGANKGAPFDTTPMNFDSQFFVETRLDEGVPGAARLPSDLALARDNRTACEWQSLIGNEDDMRTKFAAAMAKLVTVNQPVDQLIDCTEVIPGAIPPADDVPFFPGTLTVSNVDAACSATPFPALTQNPAVTTVAHVAQH